MNGSAPILFFDGYCNLCSRLVQFFLKHDKEGRVKLAPLQGQTANEFLASLNIDLSKPNTIVFYHNGHFYTESDAALNALGFTSSGLRHLRRLSFIPKVIRDFFYRLIAKNRYAWFGKTDTCYLPKPEYVSRFLP